MARALACLLLFVFASVADRAAPALGISRRTLIVVDELSLQFRSTPRLRDQIRQTLQALMRAGDLVGMTSTGHSHVAVPLSANWNAADSAVIRITGSALSPRVIASASATSEDAAELRLRAATASSIAATALGAVATGASGPVTVVYFTEGYPALVFEPSEFVQEALRVNAAIYVIDPRGFSETDRQFDAKDWEAYVAATHGNVLTLASRTGGVAVFTRGEFEATLVGLAKTIPLPK